MPATAAHLDEVALRDGVENVVSTRTARNVSTYVHLIRKSFAFPHKTHVRAYA